MRDILNLPNGMGRSIINLPNTINIAGTEPVEVIQTDSNTSVTISLKGLNGFTADKIIKVNSAGDALEYADDTNTEYTTLSPLSFVGSTNQIQLQQSLFNIISSPSGIVDADFIPIFDTNGNFDKISFIHLKTAINVSNIITATDPLQITGTDIKINEGKFITLTAINETDFVMFFNQTGIGVQNPFSKITFPNFQDILLRSGLNFGTQTATTGTRTFGNENRDTDIDGDNITITSVTGTTLLGAVSVVGTFTVGFASSLFGDDVSVFGDLALTTTGNTFASNTRKLNWSIANNSVDVASISYAGSVERLNISSRGGSGNIHFLTGSSEAIRLQITNSSLISTNNISVLDSTTTGSGVKLDMAFLNQNAGTYNVIQFGKNSFGKDGNMGKLKFFYQNDEEDGNFVSLGLETADITNTNQINIYRNQVIDFTNNGDINFREAPATGTTTQGFTKRLYLYNRGLYMYQSPFGGQGSSSVGRASWLITPGFQQFRLEFHLTSTTGTIVFMSFINGLGVYVVEFSFTGQHKSKSVNDTIYNNIEDYVGLICYATGEYATYDFDNETCNSDSSGITINDAMPVIDLTTTKKDKRVYGVISNKEDSGDRQMGYGRFCSFLPSKNDEPRVIVNGIGEGGIWVVNTNTNGNFENGDYIQTSNVAGYGEKQDDDLLHNYTVAKITCDCDFDMSSNKYKSKMIGDNIACFVGCIYYCG